MQYKNLIKNFLYNRVSIPHFFLSIQTLCLLVSSDKEDGTVQTTVWL